MTSEFGPYYEAAEPGKRERAHAWATAIGLQEVDGLKPSNYLIATAKRHIEGKISQEDARRLFRQSRPRQNAIFWGVPGMCQEIPRFWG